MSIRNTTPTSPEVSQPADHAHDDKTDEWNAACYSAEVQASAAPGDAYQTFIVENRRVCNSCFRRIRAVQPAPEDDYWEHEHSVRTSNGVSTDTLWRITTDETIGARDDGEYAAVGPVLDESGELAREGRRQVVCRHCGAVDGGDRAARPLDEFMDAAQRIAERIAEQDVPCDADALLDAARDAKRTPGLENKDFECFERAVEAGVEAALSETE